MENVANHLDQALADVQSRFRTLSKLSDTPANYARVEDFFQAVASGRRASRLMERFDVEVADRGSNLWSVVSAMTFYSSHDSDEFTIRGSSENDNVSATLLQRQLEVLSWMNSRAWETLLAA